MSNVGDAMAVIYVASIGLSVGDKLRTAHLVAAAVTAAAIGGAANIHRLRRRTGGVERVRDTITLCIDKTATIWYAQKDAPVTSQWVFIQIHEIMAKHEVTLRWSPGHCNIEDDILRDIELWVDDPKVKAVFWLNGRIDADPAIFNKALREQFEKLIYEPLSKLHSHDRNTVVRLIVVDALDECDDEEDIGRIISLLSRANGLGSSRLKVFLTSRPELPIRLGFFDVNGTYQALILHEVAQSTIEHDLYIYFKGSSPPECGDAFVLAGAQVVAAPTDSEHELAAKLLVEISHGRLELDSHKDTRLDQRLQSATPNLSLLLVVVPLYNRIKHCGDVKYGIHAVCCVGRKVAKCSDEYFANVGLKFNLNDCPGIQRSGGKDRMLRGEWSEDLTKGRPAA
ncbi:hypothetical protein F5Y17DRAFT_463899 [Xylariaceae sp. FL0594]|nr:hypothetical protein F5Y17DRAFT_463899 [Xylariaceae sp. FL0594]